MKRRSTSFGIRELQIKKKKKRRYHYTPIRMDKIQNTETPKAGKNAEQQEFSFTAGGNANCTATLEDSLVVSYKTKHTLTKGFSNHAPLCLPKGVENLCPHKNLYTNIYSSFIHDYQNLEATRCPSAG